MATKQTNQASILLGFTRSRFGEREREREKLILDFAKYNILGHRRFY